MTLAETPGSTAANLRVDPARQPYVGLEINADHLRAARSGAVAGSARPIHRSLRNDMVASRGKRSYTVASEWGHALVAPRDLSPA